MSKQQNEVKHSGIMSAQEKIGNAVMLAVLTLLSAACLYPFLIILSSSFQSQETIMNYGYRLFANSYTISAYKMIFANPMALINGYKVTVFVTVVTVLIGTTVTAMCGYVMARQDYAYKKILSYYVFFCMLFSGGMVPLYILISRWLGLRDSIWSLILPCCCSAWNLLLMKGFFANTPKELIESGKLDGASELRIFVQIIVPISTPGIATIALFLMLGAWNDYMHSLLYIETDAKYPLQYLLMKLMSNIEFLNSEEALQYGAVQAGTEIPSLAARMAMCILATGPIVIAFPFFQKYFVRGLTVGSVKG